MCSLFSCWLHMVFWKSFILFSRKVSNKLNVMWRYQVFFSFHFSLVFDFHFSMFLCVCDYMCFCYLFKFFHLTLIYFGDLVLVILLLQQFFSVNSLFLIFIQLCPSNTRTHKHFYLAFIYFGNLILVLLVLQLHFIFILLQHF